MPVRLASALLMTLLVGGSLFSGTARAQDHCNALLTHGIRNEWISISDSEWKNLIFHKHCRKSGNNWTFAHEGQVGLEMAEIPLGIAGNWFANEEEKVGFCKEQANHSEGRKLDAARLGLLSTEALRVWNQCQKLAKNARIEIGDLRAQMLAFSITRGAEPVVLQAISFLGVESCEVNGSPVVTGVPLNQTVDNGQTNVRCWRKVEQDDSGVVKFARAEIGIDTNRGQLDINLPPWESLPLVSNSEVVSKLSSLEATSATMLEEGRAACSASEAKDLCRCKKDGTGDVQLRMIVCLSVCPDGRVRDFRIEEAHGGAGRPGCPSELPSPVRTRIEEVG